MSQIGHRAVREPHAIRVAFRDRLLSELFEHYGERAHEDLLRRVGFVQ
jgi:hypothetical protein